LLSARIVNVPGSSAYFVGGFVVYANELKTRLLSVEEEAIALLTYGDLTPYGNPCTYSCAPTYLYLSLAITGISGPEGGTPDKPVGLTYIGLATDREVMVKRFLFNGGRNENRFLATQWALEMLRQYLLKGG